MTKQPLWVTVLRYRRNKTGVLMHAQQPMVMQFEAALDSLWNVISHAQKTDFVFRAKRTSPFKSAGASVQSTTGSWGVRISGSNAGYTMFRGSVKSTGYPLHLNRREGGRQFSRLLAAEVCASAVVMLDTPCSEVVWRVLATHCIRQFPLHFTCRASPCAIIFQLEFNSA